MNHLNLVNRQPWMDRKRGYLLICLSKKNQAPTMVFPSRFYKDLLASMVASKLFSLYFSKGAEYNEVKKKVYLLFFYFITLSIYLICCGFINYF